VNRDESGVLVEILRTDWTDIYDVQERPFAQTYYSITPPGLARDEDVWHVHERQEDRFVVASGDVVLALWDGRSGSPTAGTLDLLPLGQSSPDDQQFSVVIPRRVHHGFAVVGTRPAVLLNSPTRLYDPSDEGREPFEDVGARFSDGRPFSWEAVRNRLAG
jgi:dTDP-4-dehydrorhamnose 3,5-epimerase